METRKLRDLEVSAIGLGCMGMSAFYGSTDEREAIETITARSSSASTSSTRLSSTDR